jgi:threonine dehydrogenase-like Zn-dependent dehydrogenase
MIPNTMTAARAHRGRPGLALERIAVPRPGPGEVLVRVAAAGIAPGMMKLLERGRFRHLPTTPGHEVAGTVVAAGSEDAAAWMGRRVRVHPMLTCGECVYCRTDREQMCADAAMLGHAAMGNGPMPLYARYHDGGLADYVVAPASLVDPLPDNVSFEVGAKVHDLANAVRALQCAALPESGRLVITAATGTMGTASIKLARFFGAKQLVLVGRSAERLAAVRRLAGSLPVRTVALDELAAGWESGEGLATRLRDLLPQGADAVLDFLPGGPASAQVVSALASGGSFVHMGGSDLQLPFPLRVLMHNCWRIVGTRSCTRSDGRAVLDLLARAELQVDELITHRFSLADIATALAATGSREEPMWMTVVHPTHDDDNAGALHG